MNNNVFWDIFVAMKKHGAARAVFNKIPAGSIDIIIKTWQMQVNLSHAECCLVNTMAIVLDLK